MVASRWRSSWIDPQPTSDFEPGDSEAEAVERAWHDKRDAVTDNVFSGVLWAQRQGVEDAIADQIRVIEGCDQTGYGLADPRGQVRHALVQRLTVEFVDRVWPLGD